VIINNEIHCDGVYKGHNCGRILGISFSGTIEIKCPKCGLIKTYTNSSSVINKIMSEGLVRGF